MSQHASVAFSSGADTLVICAVVVLLTLGAFPVLSSQLVSPPPVTVAKDVRANAVPSPLLSQTPLRTAASYPLGTDVFGLTGTVNWTQAYGAGIRFAFAKASQGTTYTDGQFSANMVNGTAAGIHMGGYDYACPVTDSGVYCTATNATTEADFFLNIAGPYMKSGYLYPALDLEEGCGSISAQAMTNWVVEWMTTVQNWAKTNLNETIVPFLYTYSSFITGGCITSTVSQYNLWIANYQVSSPGIGFFPTWVFWQFTSTASIPGVGPSGSNQDEDYFNGNVSQITAYTFGGNGSGVVPLHSTYGIKDLTTGSIVNCTNTVSSGDVLQFSATVTGGTSPYSYLWKFGDGTTGTGNPSNHSYTAAATVTPLLTVTDSKGLTNTTGQGCTLTISSGMTLTKALAASPNPVVAGSTTNFSVTVSGGTAPYSYVYKGLPPGCSSLSSSTLACTPTGSGNYTVTVYANDSAKHSVTSSTLLTVKPSTTGPTLVGVTIQAPSSTVAAGSSETLTALPTCSGGSCPASISYLWSANNSLGNLSSLTGLTTAFTAGSKAGSVDVTVSATLGTTSQTGSTAITITSSTTPTITQVSIAPLNPTVQVNSTTSFTATPQCTGGACPSGVTYLWTLNNSKGNLTSSTGSSTTYTAAAAPGVVSLRVQASLSTSSATSYSNITITGVGQVQLKSVAILPSPTSLATGSTTSISATPRCAGGACPSTGIAYAWTVSNSLASVSPSTGASVTLTVANTAGTFVLSVKAVLSPTTVSNSTTVSVTAPGGGQITSVSISPGSGSIPSGASSNYSASLACAGSCPSGVTYSWAYTNQSLGTLNVTSGPLVKFTSNGSPGSITLTVTASAGTSSVQSSVNVTIRGSSGGSSSNPSPLSSGMIDYLLIGLIALVVVIAVAVVLRSRAKRARPSESPWEAYPPMEPPA